MKPFNLEHALAGDPVITRDGKKVIECVYLKKRERFNLLALIQEGLEEGEDDQLKAFTDDGKFCSDKTEFDLFMAPIKKKYYVNVYEHGVGYIAGICHTTWEDAQDKKKTSGYVKTIEFEIEE